MSGFENPKLYEEGKYDSVCALCANEIAKGAPLWWFNGKAYCMEHSKAEIRTEGAAPSHIADNPSPCGPPSTVTIRFDVPELTMFKDMVADLNRIHQAIDLQIEVLKGMRKDNNERR